MWTLRKITVALESPLYSNLIDYVATKSKTNRSRPNVSESASELIARALSSPRREEETEAR